MNQLLSWLSDYTLFVSAAAAVSIALMILSCAATPWFVASLPSDYLQPKVSGSRTYSLFNILILVFRNIVGLALIILGLIMMVTPGPGLIGLLVGVSLAEFPGKHRILISIAIQPDVFKSLNWMRMRHGKAPFDYPDTNL